LGGGGKHVAVRVVGPIKNAAEDLKGFNARLTLLISSALGPPFLKATCLTPGFEDENVKRCIHEEEKWSLGRK